VRADLTDMSSAHRAGGWLYNGGVSGNDVIHRVLARVKKQALPA
jgi:hypothetical protein